MELKKGFLVMKVLLFTSFLVIGWGPLNFAAERILASLLLRWLK